MVGAVVVLDQVAAGERLVARRDQIGARIGREHAGHGARGGDVEAANRAVRIWRAQHVAPGLARHADIGRIQPLAPQQARVLVARDRLPGAEFLDRRARREGVGHCKQSH
jgi:hypothetical protein